MNKTKGFLSVPVLIVVALIAVVGASAVVIQYSISKSPVETEEQVQEKEEKLGVSVATTTTSIDRSIEKVDVTTNFEDAEILESEVTVQKEVEMEEEIIEVIETVNVSQATQPDASEKYILAPATGITIEATEELVKLDVYDKLGSHVGLRDLPAEADTDLRFFEAQIPNSAYREYSNRIHISIDVGDPDYSGDDYYRIEIKGLLFGITEFTFVDNSTGNDLSKIYFPISPVSKGFMTIEEGVSGVDFNKLQYDVNGDGKIDYEFSHKDGVKPSVILEIAKRILIFTNLEEFEKNDVISRIANAQEIIVNGDSSTALKIVNEIFSNSNLYLGPSEMTIHESFLRIIGTALALYAEVE